MKFPGAVDANALINRCQYSLTDNDIARYLYLGETFSRGLEEVISQVRPGDMERDIVGRINENLVASMDQDAIGTGYEGVKAALTILEGGTVDEWIKIGGKVVSGDNAQDYLDNFAAHGFSE